MGVYRKEILRKRINRSKNSRNGIRWWKSGQRMFVIIMMIKWNKKVLLFIVCINTVKVKVFFFEGGFWEWVVLSGCLYKSIVSGLLIIRIYWMKTSCISMIKRFNIILCPLQNKTYSYISFRDAHLFNNVFVCVLYGPKMWISTTDMGPYEFALYLRNSHRTKNLMDA